MEASIRDMIHRGATLGDVAVALGVDPTTARRRLRAAGVETHRQRVLREAAAARDVGDSALIRSCRTHGDQVFRLDARGSYRCPECNKARVTARRRRIKEILIEEAGGACDECGYHRCTRALGFHHLDPGAKAFGVARGGHTRSLARAREEAAKCVLLCSNCHMEVEAGFRCLAYTEQFGGG